MIYIIKKPLTESKTKRPLKEGEYIRWNKGDKIVDNMDNIRISGYIGRWYVIDSEEVDGKKYFLLEHETYGDETSHLLVDEEGTEIAETDDDIRQTLYDNDIIDTLDESKNQKPLKEEFKRCLDFIDLEFKLMDLLEDEFDVLFLNDTLYTNQYGDRGMKFEISSESKTVIMSVDGNGQNVNLHVKGQTFEHIHNVQELADKIRDIMDEFSQEE